MTVNMLGAEMRLGIGSGDERQVHLSAMRMAAKRERHALRHTPENERLMSQQDDRRIIRHLGQSSGQVVDALEAARSGLMRQLVAKPRYPEGVALVVHADSLVLEHRDVGVAERSADALAVVAAHARKRTMPPVVIAEDGIDTERRLEDRQGFAHCSG